MVGGLVGTGTLEPESLGISAGISFGVSVGTGSRGFCGTGFGDSSGKAKRKLKVKYG